MAKPDVVDEIDHQEQKPRAVTIDLVLSPLERRNHLIVDDNQNKVAEDQEMRTSLQQSWTLGGACQLGTGLPHRGTPVPLTSYALILYLIYINTYYT